MLSTIELSQLYNVDHTAAVVEQSKITLQLKLWTYEPEKAQLNVSIKQAF